MQTRKVSVYIKWNTNFRSYVEDDKRMCIVDSCICFIRKPILDMFDNKVHFRCLMKMHDLDRYVWSGEGGGGRKF